MNHDYFIKEAITLAVESVNESGGPFGAVIVSPQGKIIGTGRNKVTHTNDPTAHAEVQATR